MPYKTMESVWVTWKGGVMKVLVLSHEAYRVADRRVYSA